MTGPNADTTLTRLVVVGSYPGVLAIGFAVYAALVASGWQVTAASWVAVITGAALVTLHEARLPYRKEWHPTGSDVRADATFLAAVQAVLPLLFSVSVVVAFADLLDAGGLAVDGLWPHGFPIAAQVVLMIAAADFPRYWLHRAFHRFLPMWRLHAVHHSPHRLYWLNVGASTPSKRRSSTRSTRCRLRWWACRLRYSLGTSSSTRSTASSSTPTAGCGSGRSTTW